mgnify:CR=1 FL=1
MSDDYSYESDDSPTNPDIHEALGQSDAFLDFQERVSRAAPVNRPVLLVGERGTGKELAASRLHYLSKRWDGPFIALNCAAVPMSLIEAELFGHEAGAFTGAGSKRIGRFESAHNGTLFLDEIGNIPLEAQEKILRAVEYGKFERVGSSTSIEVNVRIIGATNANLRDMAEVGTFMPDLLDRLSFEVIVIPPLRERLEDIPLLANHFAARMAMELEWAALPEITDEAMDELCAFQWPGNVRELKNVIERAVYRSNDMIIDKDELIFDPFDVFSSGEYKSPKTPPAEPTSQREESASIPPKEDALIEPASFTEAVRELELRMLQAALHDTKYNQRKAAEHLGLTYHQFRGLYRKYQDDVAE